MGLLGSQRSQIMLVPLTSLKQKICQIKEKSDEGAQSRKGLGLPGSQTPPNDDSIIIKSRERAERVPQLSKIVVTEKQRGASSVWSSELQLQRLQKKPD